MKTTTALLLGAALAAALTLPGCKKETEAESTKSAAPTAAPAPAAVESASELTNADATASANASASATPPPPPSMPRVDVCEQVLRAAAAGKCTEARNLVPSCTGPKAIAARSSLVACLKGR
ncbi:MAG: hypothetical protein FJ095_17140 [Deltaproteobacteria bacterium]|nr:hypothetical protein [Deltaproteobacteria bacterium]